MTAEPRHATLGFIPSCIYAVLSQQAVADSEVPDVARHPTIAPQPGTLFIVTLKALLSAEPSSHFALISMQTVK